MPVNSRTYGVSPSALRGDDPEREVDRARDLPVRDAEQVGSAEPALEPRKLSRHGPTLTRRRRYSRPHPPR